MSNTSYDIEQINHILSTLSEESIRDIKGYITYIKDREEKRKAFKERILHIKDNPDGIICNSVEDVMQAIYNSPDEDDDNKDIPY